MMATKNFFMRENNELILISTYLKKKRGNAESELFSQSLWKLQLEKG